jgi:hypothetical protein
VRLGALAVRRDHVVRNIADQDLRHAIRAQFVTQRDDVIFDIAAEGPAQLAIAGLTYKDSKLRLADARSASAARH